MLSVEVIPFDSLTMSDAVKSWLSQRSLNCSAIDEYPEDTWMAMHENEFIACGSLVKTNTTVAFLHGLTTNPKSVPMLRHLAIDEIVKKIIKTAQYLGFKTLFAWTEDSGILKRSFEYGFKPINQIMIGVDLKGD